LKMVSTDLGGGLSSTSRSCARSER